MNLIEGLERIGKGIRNNNHADKAAASRRRLREEQARRASQEAGTTSAIAALYMFTEEQLAAMPEVLDHKDLPLEQVVTDILLPIIKDPDRKRSVQISELIAAQLAWRQEFDNPDLQPQRRILGEKRVTQITTRLAILDPQPPSNR